MQLSIITGRKSAIFLNSNLETYPINSSDHHDLE